MKKTYFTITGTNHYYGLNFFEPKMTVHLVKEPDNKHDKEAIRVELEGLGKVGYVANSSYTVLGESFSAGRLYDKIGKAAEGEVLYKLRNGVLCVLTENDDPDYAAKAFKQAKSSPDYEEDEYAEADNEDNTKPADDKQYGGVTIEIPDVVIKVM